MESLLYLIFVLLIFVFISSLILITITYDKKNSIKFSLTEKKTNKSKCIKKDPVTKNEDLLIPDNIQLTFRSREEDLKNMTSISEFSNNYTHQNNSIISSSNMNLRHNPYIITKYKPCKKNINNKKNKIKTKKNNITNEVYDSMYYDKNNKSVQKKNIKWLPVKESECLI